MSSIIRLLAQAIANPVLQRLGLAKLLSVLVRLIFACQISPGVRIGRNLSLGYGGLGIVIHGDTRIGDDVAIGPHVLIGGNLGKGGVPTIGDRVRVGPGAKLLGPIHIGADAIVAPNAVVNSNVEAGTIVGGIPARVIARSRERSENA